MSPDMNPIVHVWDFIGRTINQRNPAMELSEQPLLLLKMLYNSGSMWPNVVVHEHWPVSQRMIVEMGNYAWSEQVFFSYALPTVMQWIGGNETLHFRTTTFWAQLFLGVGV
jgi:hypothetical protein